MLISKNCLQLKNNIKPNISHYFGYLNIPKINLSLGFYKIDDIKNNINEGIKLVLFREDIIVIAGRTSFDNLTLLKINDEIIIRQRNKNEKYIIENIYLEKKNGNLKITKLKNEKILILMANSLKKEGYQLIIRALKK